MLDFESFDGNPIEPRTEDPARSGETGDFLTSATAATTNTTSLAGQPVVPLQTLADYLYSGYYGQNKHWGSNTISVNISGLTADEQLLARKSFAAWSSVCNLTFVETTSVSANIYFSHSGSGASTGVTTASDGTILSADVSISTSWMTSYYYDAASWNGSVPYNNYAFQTYLHEIGHALGLGHQGPYNGSATYGVNNIYANDSWQFSIMSYMGQDNYNYGGLGCSYMWITGPMQADIIAMQMKYGAPSTTTIRKYGYQADQPFVNFDVGGQSFCMYATDGWVQLDGRGWSGAQTVDMRAGAFSSLRGKLNNISTAAGVRMRDYWCGTGGDTVHLSSGGVNVYGNTGADTFYDYGSGAGINTLNGGGNHLNGSGSVVDRVIFNAAKAGFSFKHTSQATNGWTVTGAGYNDALTNISSVVFTDRTVTLRQAASNFNFGAANDVGATSDFLLFNGSNVVTWTMQNGAYNTGAVVGNAAGWTIVGTGDFNGDGAADILLKNAAGDIVDWTMSNGSVSGGSAIGNASGWDVVGTGDFNGDGTTDILFKNAAGDIVDWTMSNGSFSAGKSVGNANGWSVVGTGDFNGDGVSDILLQNAAGAVVEWTMQNGVYSSGAAVGGAAGWNVVGCGDFNGDGVSDILLRQASTGALADWIMQNGAYSSGHVLGAASGWNVASVGDYNGDGVADIGLTNGSSLVYWGVQNGVVTSSGGIGGLNGYSVVG